MKSIELIVRLVIKKENKVLLCKNKKGGHYFLPGGHVEFNDSIEKTIYKEMAEELGLKKEQISNITYLNYLEQMFINNGENHHEFNIIFTAKIPLDTNIVSKENHIDFEWINTKDIKNIKLLPKRIISFI